MKYHNQIIKVAAITLVASISFLSQLLAQVGNTPIARVVGNTPVTRPAPSPSPTPVVLGNGRGRIPTEPFVQAEYVLIQVKHQRQETQQCVPTSASMMLASIGLNYPPRQIKLATLRKPYYGPSTPFNYYTPTSFSGLPPSLKYLNIFNWRCATYLSTELARGLTDIKNSLRRKYPVMLCLTEDTGYGHAVVVCGFDDKNLRLITSDPAIDSPGIRYIPYSQLDKRWSNKFFGNASRMVTFMY